MFGQEDQSRCFICQSDDVFVVLGIALGMSGDDYAVCESCLSRLSALEFVREIFIENDLAWPPVFKRG